MQFEFPLRMTGDENRMEWLIQDSVVEAHMQATGSNTPLVSFNTPAEIGLIKIYFRANSEYNKKRSGFDTVACVKMENPKFSAAKLSKILGSRQIAHSEIKIVKPRSSVQRDLVTSLRENRMEPPLTQILEEMYLSPKMC